MPKNREQIDMDTPVDTGADVGDALRDLSEEDFTALMAELGHALFGPKEAPAQTPEAAKAQRLNGMRNRIRDLIQRGFRINPEAASPFTADQMMQSRMESYESGSGAGTGHSAKMLSDRIKRGSY